MSSEDKAGVAALLVELEKATFSGDIVWDVELFGDVRNPQRRYTAGVVFSNGAVGCVMLQHEGLMFVNSHEYREPEAGIRKLFGIVAGPNSNVVRFATEGLRQRMNELQTAAVDLNEM